MFRVTQMCFNWCIVPEYRLDYFIVGITNDSPLVKAPVRGGYPLCGQYPNPALAGTWMAVKCMDAAPSGQFVIVQQPASDFGFLTICECEVYPRCAWPGPGVNYLCRSGTSTHFILSARALFLCWCMHGVLCICVNLHNQNIELISFSLFETHNKFPAQEWASLRQKNIIIICCELTQLNR